MSIHSTRKARSGWLWLLVLPYIGLLIPQIYARSGPSLAGFPFFYWYQFSWVIFSSLITGIVYLKTTRRSNHKSQEHSGR